MIGLFPVLGSLVKGVLKIFFLFIRRSGGNTIAKAVDEAMTWVITLLRKKEVMTYWRKLRWGNVFAELANAVKKVRSQVQLGALLQAFDRGIGLLDELLGKLRYVPLASAKAKQTLEMVKAVRLLANSHLEKAIKPIQDALDVIVRRLELENLAQHRGVLNTTNVHFRGGLPEARAVSLMRKAEPPPAWLSRGKPGEFLPLDPEEKIKTVNEKAAQGYPKINEDQISSFANGMEAVELVGPQRLYRVVSPSGVASAQDWVTEAVFNQIKAAADPKSAWRKHLAVWPDWNVNGQFVIYELKAGETLKVWKGPAAAQVKPEAADLLNRFLEGGWEQVKFDSSQVRSQTGESIGQAFDSMTYYRVDRATGRMELDPTMNRSIYRNLLPEEQVRYECLRDRINHPAISGPFDTGWGMTDFDAQLSDVRLGLPALPGQLTELKR